ncbi:hypothetical protein ACQEVM_35615 [Streptomyces sp. CA-243310]|uniref:hypothetical protein n=1 Tax=Streptomyces sp. CA-243310 TaxID=3240056 RepID=UPI003D8E31AF
MAGDAGFPATPRIATEFSARRRGGAGIDASRIQAFEDLDAGSAYRGVTLDAGRTAILTDDH